MDHLRHVRRRVATVPRTCGVYRWLNEKGEVLYIGKAKRLRDRMRGYVAPKIEKSITVWKKSLREKIRDFDITLTQSELEAIVLETNLIKELRPKYNVLMKDDKNYVYVCVTLGEEYPRLEVVRRMGDRSAKYFGPFVKARETNERLDMLHELWGWRACGKKRDKPCLEYQIGKCNGLCVGKISKKEYRERIEKVMRFLKGDHREAIARLGELMNQSAVQKKFERAARFRDILERLQQQEKQVVSDTSRENLDTIGMAVYKDNVQVVLLRERNGRLIEELSFVLTGKCETRSSALEQFLEQYYSEAPDVPEEIIIGEALDDISLWERWLGRVRIFVPVRGKKKKLLHMAEFNAAEKLKQQFASFEREKTERKSALQELKNILKLKKSPRRIEGYDISHLGGTETVGSMVVFKSGKPASGEYRSFTIRMLQSGDIDDYAALKEVLERRLKYLLDKTYRDPSLTNKPDLLVIDGGKGQLQMAVRALKEYALDIPVIALAKRHEEVFRPDEPLPVSFDRDSPAVFLLMRLRDEAHRRAHQHHEKRHTRQLGL